MDELKKMQVTDLLRELKAQDLLVEEMRMGIKMQKEKDTARYRREKRQLARMKTALAEKEHVRLPAKRKPSTVSSSAPRSVGGSSSRS